MEAILTDQEMAAIATMCRGSNAPTSRWNRMPSIARGFALLAIDRLALELQAGGLSRTQARDAAALRLGIPPETVSSWRKRWRKDAYGTRATQRVQSAPRN